MGPNMPVSCENSDSAISSSIRDSLGNYNGLTKASNLGLTKNQLSAALKQSLLKTIEYVESPPGFGFSIQDTLKAKYTILRPSEEDKTTAQSIGGSTSQLSKNGNGTKLNGACLPSPKVNLYPRERIQIGWGNAKKWSVGSGMVNLGNTCYLNSTLQALFHVPSFANWLHSDREHRSQCEELSGSQTGCIICSMADVLHSTQQNQCPTKPVQVYSKLKQICRHLVHGHQEDAHEFLRYLMESMEKAFLTRYKNSKDFEQYTKETTPINQILGGYLRTSVKCLSCQYESVTFQHFEDLLLDIRKVNTIDEALKHHFARERLEDMDYTCESCKKKVSATKQFSLERAPVALCIQLKRFSGINGKISKHINISPDLDFSQYSSRDTKNSQLKYRLVSMITHLGSTPQCGHYTAIGCCQDGSYYQFDDSSVRTMSMNHLMNTNPYIVFYELVPGTKTSTITSMENSNSKRTETSTQFIGPMLPSPANQLIKPILSPITNGCAMKPYGLTSNGFAGDNRKLITISNNQIMTPKKNTDPASSTTAKLSSTTGSSSSNETFTKNGDKSWTKVSGAPPPTVNTSALPMSEPLAKPTNRPSNETVTKKSVESRNSSDSESEMPSSPKMAILPSMPELKPNSPATLKNGDTGRSSNGINGIQSIVDGGGDGGNMKRNSDNESLLSTQKETVTTNSLQRKSHSPLPYKGTVAVYSSPPVKSHSPINQKSEENRKLITLSHRESADSENKIRSPSLTPTRQTTNPFSRVSNGLVKSVKHKTNGYVQPPTQRNAKPTNGYVVSPRKSLVPYALHDDSDSNNEDRKSPPIVKIRTKAGPFQVTKNTTNGHTNHGNGGDQRLPWSKSSNGGRVPSLSGWNGPSVLQDEIINEQRENSKRKSEKDFDLDLDMGRMKKKRRNAGYNGEQRDNPNYNAFQEHQRNQRPSQHHRRGSYGNCNGSYAYRISYTGKRKY